MPRPDQGALPRAIFALDPAFVVAPVDRVESHGPKIDTAKLGPVPEAPDRVVPRRGAGAAVDGATLQAVLPAVSWTALRLHPVTARTPTA